MNDKLILKSQQNFRRKKYNVFTKEVNKIALSANRDKRIHSVDSIETYTYETSKDLVCKKEEPTCNNVKTINYDVTKERHKPIQSKLSTNS